MGFTARLPGMQPGNWKRNSLLGVLYLFVVVPLAVLLLPVVVGLAVGGNYRGSATALSRLPGISASGGLFSGAVALGYGLSVYLLVGAVAPSGGSSPVLDSTAGPSAGTNATLTATATRSPTSTPSPTQTPTTLTPTSTQTPTTTTTMTETPTTTTAREPSTSTDTVTVVEVVDGDTIDVRYGDGSTERVRLLGVDAPEIHTTNEPAEFDGVPATTAGTDCLRDFGHEATAFARAHLSGKTVRLQLEDEADRRVANDRLLAYVYVDGRNFNHNLVETGHARVVDSQFSLSEQFSATEADAQASGRGLWHCRNVKSADDDSGGSGALDVAWIQADAPGDDHTNENEEFPVSRDSGLSLASGST